MPGLKALTIDLIVKKDDKVLYRATTWAGYIGVLTAMRPGFTSTSFIITQFVLMLVLTTTPCVHHFVFVLIVLM